jgi:hypothetical protein
MSVLFQPPRGVIFASGQTVPNAYVYFYVTESTTPKDVYADVNLTTPRANPVQADSTGTLPLIYLNTSASLYRVRITQEDGTQISQDDGIGQILSQGDVGRALYPRTTAELSAGVTPTNYAYEPYDMRRYFSGETTADSSAAFNSAIDMCLAQGIRELVAPGKWTITAPIYIDNWSNDGFTLRIDELHAGTTGTWAATPADWKDATAMINVGTDSNGAGINLSIYIGRMSGNSRKADGIHIGDGSYGCGASYFYVGYASDMNIFGKIDRAIWPCASNVFEGRWIGASNLGFWLKNTTSPAHCEATVVRYGFINHCDYGGVIGYGGSQYLTVHDGLDFNGEYLTELEVGGFSTFANGDEIVGGTSGTEGEIIAMYNYQNANFILVIERTKVVDAASGFDDAETITAGAATTNVVGSRAANQSSSNFYFDIILAAKDQSFHKANIYADYLGGIVGAHLHTCTIFRKNSADAIGTQLMGMGIGHSGSVLSLTDYVGGEGFLDVAPTYFAPKGGSRHLYLGGDGFYRSVFTDRADTALPDGVATTVLTLPAAFGVYLINVAQTTDVALRALGVAFVQSSGTVSYTSIAANSLTISVSGSNIQALHGTGGSKTVRATVVRLAY